MNKYTVILIRPDYIGDSADPVDHCIERVVEANPDDAVVQAQNDAALADGNIENATNYYALTVIAGHPEILK